MQLGPEIKIDGKRPEWLKDNEKIGIVWKDGTRWDHLNTPVDWVSGWKYGIEAIMLPTDHPYYLATSKGFTYWPGGESAPDDWDGGEVLFRGGGEVLFRYGACVISPTSWSHPWNGENGTGVTDYDIIGYRRKTKSDAVSTNLITRAEAYEDGLDIPTLEKLGLLAEETLLEKFARENPFFTETEFKVVQEFIDWQENNQ
jgi:hypothetical protein